MAQLEWDKAGERFYETGVNRGVLYLPTVAGVYSTGVAWNGLTAVNESPSGAESNPHYADNIKYLDLQSAEEFSFTIEALYYPDEFEECDGTAKVGGVGISQQDRRPFGMSYTTLVGNDTQGNARGKKIHLVYGAKAAPSERGYSTVNESPEPIGFSWECSTTPVTVGTISGKEYKPTSLVTVDSTDTAVTAAKFAALEAILYGDADSNARLPLPDEVWSILNNAA